MAAKNGNLGSGPCLVPSAQSGSLQRSGAVSGAILIADDNQDDGVHSKKIVQKALAAPVHIVSGGEEAIAYLEGQGPYQDRAAYPYPVVLLLDLRMPGMDGLEVLKWLARKPEHRALPVVVLSAVREVPMVSRAYQLGARTFLIKPLTVDELKRTLQALALWPDADAPSAEPKASDPAQPHAPPTTAPPSQSSPDTGLADSGGTAAPV